MSARLRHTPGPWSIDPRYDGDAGDGIEVYRKPKRLSPGSIQYDRLICRVPETDDYMGGKDDLDEDEATAEIEANAALIAAAPDLLAALRVMIGDDTTPNIGGIAMARAAIARAEGGPK